MKVYIYYDYESQDMWVFSSKKERDKFVQSIRDYYTKCEYSFVENEDYCLYDEKVVYDTSLLIEEE